MLRLDGIASSVEEEEEGDRLDILGVPGDGTKPQGIRFEFLGFRDWDTAETPTGGNA
jgi:hypothetical protein